MIRDVGTLGRTTRLALGALLTVGVGNYAGLSSLRFGLVPAALGTAFVAIAGVVLPVTGADRISPLYLPFGIDTFDDRD